MFVKRFLEDTQEFTELEYVGNINESATQISLQANEVELSDSPL
jgi:hypothetical protein